MKISMNYLKSRMRYSSNISNIKKRLSRILSLISSLSSLMAVMTILSSCFVSCAWYKFRVVDNPLAQYNIHTLSIPMFFNRSALPNLAGPLTKEISLLMTEFPHLRVYPGTGEKTDAILKKNYPDFTVVWFGHIGDGNMHINILKPDNLDREQFLKKCSHANDLLFEVIRDLNGSISAEHGVGLVKKPYLEFTRSAEEIALMKGIKAVFDPDQIMNPGKVFD